MSSRDTPDPIYSLFEKALAADDPAVVFASESNPAVAEAARNLYRNHQAAEQAKFLDQPIGLTTDDLSGHTIGHFRIVRLLGTGGMGRVFLAEDVALKRKVALKFLALTALPVPGAVERFRLEARAAAALKHPHICTIYGVEEVAGLPVIEMEFVEGETLAARLERAPLLLHEVLRLAVEIGGAIEEAHRIGIVHRDLKPGNVMLTKFGAKVLDFGLAKFAAARDAAQSSMEAETASMSVTLEGMRMGTPYYMSPEQSGGEEVDARTDLFSLGVVLYEASTGVRPFTGDGVSKILASVMKDAPAHPSRVRKGLPPAWNAIIAKALAKDRDRRYQTAAELVAECVRLRDRSAGASLRRVLQWSAAAAMVAAAYAGWTIASRKAAPLGATDTIVLADFANATQETVFDLTLKEALSAGLVQSPFLNILTQQKVGETLKLMGKPADAPLSGDTAREVCVRAGARAYVAGSISRLGSQYVLTLQAVDCASTNVFAREQATAEAGEQVLTSLDAAAKKLRSNLGETLRSVEKFATPLERATTPSLSALQAYTYGRRDMIKGDPTRAQEFLQRAIGLDPEFAMAHLSLGMAYWAAGETELGEKSITRAFELRQRVSEWERFAIESRYFYSVVGDLEAARRIYEAWAEAYPREAIPLNVLGEIYAVLGSLDRSVSVYRDGLRLTPGASPTGLAYSYLATGRPTDAARTLTEALPAAAGIPDLHHLLYLTGYYTHQQDAMAREFEWSRGMPGAESALTFDKAMTAAAEGRLAEARELSRRAVTLAEQAGEREVEANYIAQSALREALFGYPEEARRLAAAALALSHSRDVSYGAGLALAMAGDYAAAQQIAKGLEARLSRGTISRYICIPAIRGQVEAGRGNSARAIEILEPAAPYELGIWGTLTPSIYVAFVRAEAYLAARRYADAVREFEKILGHRGIVLNEPIGPMSRLGRARALARKGDTAKARGAYEEFLAEWKDADRGIPVLRQATVEYQRLRQ